MTAERQKERRPNTHRFEIKHLGSARLGPCSRGPIPGHRDVTRHRQVNDTLTQIRTTAVVKTGQAERLGARGSRNGGKHVGRGPRHYLVWGGLGRHAVEGEYTGNAWLDHEKARVGLAVVGANRVQAALFRDDLEVIELCLV